jgi:hypothetical protein
MSLETLRNIRGIAGSKKSQGHAPVSLISNDSMYQVYLLSVHGQNLHDVQLLIVVLQSDSLSSHHSGHQEKVQLVFCWDALS